MAGGSLFQGMPLPKSSNTYVKDRKRSKQETCQVIVTTSPKLSAFDCIIVTKKILSEINNTMHFLFIVKFWQLGILQVMFNGSSGLGMLPWSCKLQIHLLVLISSLTGQGDKWPLTITLIEKQKTAKEQARQSTRK